MGLFSAVKKIFSSKKETDISLENTHEQEKVQGNIQNEIQGSSEKISPENLHPDKQIFSDPQKCDQQHAQTPEKVQEQDFVQAKAQVQSSEITLANTHEKIKKQNNEQEAPLTPLPLDADFQTVTLALRKTEPKLSAWLHILLENIEEVDDIFWTRLSYLLKALETPEEEAQAFLTEFKAWLVRMDYMYLNDFRSELQYRLALALDLEDEEDERDRLFLKVQQGLERTRNQLGRGLQTLFSSHDKLGEPFYEELEELFIMSDMGAELSLKLVAKLREHAKNNKIESAQDLLPYLQEEVTQLFKTPKIISAINPPEVVLMIGVNGVGKTTTIAKLAYRAQMQGKKVLIAGADTFRAAAVEQLETWAKRIGADFYSKGSGADPAAVAYEAMDKAVAGAYDIVFIDTAGRLHNKSNLMDELQKIRNVIAKKHDGAPHRSVLVIDATTGQNAMQQTKVFKESAGTDKNGLPKNGVDEIILTKLDGTAKGGVALAVASTFEVPITYIGLGEKMEDLRPFHAPDFAKALFGDFAIIRV